MRNEMVKVHGAKEEAWSQGRWASDSMYEGTTGSDAKMNVGNNGQVDTILGKRMGSKGKLKFGS